MLWLLGCLPQLDPSSLEMCSFFVDADGDGFGTGDAVEAACASPPEGHSRETGDCADDDRGRHPGVEERCDGEDEDCDGLVDDEPRDGDLVFSDADGDGYGTESLGRACEVGEGQAELSGDCDDTWAEAHPGADETCDGTDEDCDGDIDDFAADRPSWYADADGDGYGSGAVLIQACEGPSGSAPRAGDCDESSVEANPGQSAWFTTPRPGGSFDYDCDGTASLQYPDTGTCENDTTCVAVVGFKGQPPGCGEEGVLLTACSESCGPVLEAAVQACR